MKIDNFVYTDDLWVFRARSRLAIGTTPLVILGRDYTVSYNVDGEVEELLVPAGLVFDGPSVPRVFQGLVSKMGRYFEASVVHDSLYGDDVDGQEFADKVFLAAMVAAGVGRVKRQLIYRAVRLFGGRVFGKTKNEFVDVPPFEKED